MLEAMTQYTAAKVGADVITVDMQDLMELTSDIFNSKGAGTDQKPYCDMIIVKQGECDHPSVLTTPDVGDLRDPLSHS